VFDFGDLGKTFIVVGLLIAGIGLLLVLARNIPFLGRLPGDITIQTQGISCFIPIATSIILSIVLTILLNILLRYLNR
jgi:DUF2905 family protein